MPHKKMIPAIKMARRTLTTPAQGVNEVESDPIDPVTRESGVDDWVECPQHQTAGQGEENQLGNA